MLVMVNMVKNTQNKKRYKVIARDEAEFFVVAENEEEAEIMAENILHETETKYEFETIELKE